MRALTPLELGVMFWANPDAGESIRSVTQFGLSAGQLGFGGDLPLDNAVPSWTEALSQNPHFTIPTAVCSYRGEDYADFGSVEHTVGLTPPATRSDRVARTKNVAKIAAQLGIGSVACHIGVIASDRTSNDYRALCDVARDLCDYLGANGQQFTLETGQEPASALLDFLADVNRGNLKINFDPANMILYGTGDPIAALRELAPHVVSVHCKDGVGPNAPGALGEERPLGEGAVDFAQLLAALKEVHYGGILSIEREEPDLTRRTADIHHAVRFLESLLSA